MNRPTTQTKRDARAHQIYEKMTRYAGRWGYVAALVMGLVGGQVSRYFGVEFGDFWFILLFGVCLLAPHPILHFWAKSRVRRAGLPHETRRETEIVRRTTANVAGRWMENLRPNDILTKTFVGLAFFIAGASLLAVGGTANSQILAILCLCGVALCFVCAIWYFLNVNLPYLRVDDRGVFGYVFGFVPRLVRWEQVDAVHFVYHDNPLTWQRHWVVHLKDAGAKSCSLSISLRTTEPSSSSSRSNCVWLMPRCRSKARLNL